MPWVASAAVAKIGASVLTHSKEAEQSGAGAAELCNDCVGFCCPDKGHWVLVSMVDPVGDGGLELRDVVEGSTTDALSCDLGEQALDKVEPGR